MSLLLTAVATRGDDIEAVVAAAASWFGSLGIAVSDRAESARWSAVEAFGPDAGGWVVLLPPYVVPSDQLGLGISRAGFTTSAVSIYEDVYWTHVLCADGEVLDRFVNLPGYFGDEDDPGPAWSGRADVVGDALGVDAATIAAYLQQFPADGDLPDVRAHADDAFGLLDGWVITDLWRRLGITYPDVWSPVAEVWLPAGYDRLVPKGRV